MKEIYFNDREGQTVLSSDERKGMLLSHISNMAELDEAEQENINSGLLWLQSYKGEYLTEGFFKKLHKKLFGEVWSWAGVYRKSAKNIGVDYWRIGPELYKLLNDVRYWIENKTYNREELLTHFHHRLVFIHPFPNGNGRFSRIITNFLCQQCDFKKPTWHAGKYPQERRRLYINALKAADEKNYSLLIEFFRED